MRSSRRSRRRERRAEAVFGPLRTRCEAVTLPPMMNEHHSVCRPAINCKRAVALVVALGIGSSASAGMVRCPKWEAGARYPWQSNEVLRGDKFALVILDVDRG